MLIGGAAINRDFGRRALYPHGKESDEVYEPGVFYCKDAFAGPRHDRRAGRRGGARGAGREDPRRGARAAREARSVVDDSAADDRRLGALGGRAPTTPIPEPPFWGVREVEVDLDEVYPYLDRHVLFKLHWGGRGKKGEEWRRIVEGHDGDEGFAPKLERMWREQDYLRPAGAARLLPLQRRRQRAGDLRPRRSTTARSSGSSSRASPSTTASASPTSTGPLDSGERDVVALQAVTVGPEVTERIDAARARRRVRRAALRPRARGPGGRGAGRVAARRGPPRARDRPRPGPPLLVGLPGLPRAVRAREGLAPARPRGDRHRRSPAATRVEPEQSTVAIIAHHPQAVYFGMKSGFIPAEKKGDELIAGTERGGELPPDADLEGDGTIEAEARRAVDGPGDGLSRDPESRSGETDICVPGRAPPMGGERRPGRRSPSRSRRLGPPARRAAPARPAVVGTRGARRGRSRSCRARSPAQPVRRR